MIFAAEIHPTPENIEVDDGERDAAGLEAIARKRLWRVGGAEIASFPDWSLRWVSALEISGRFMPAMVSVYYL
jgi:hypothetical protein